VERVLDLPTDGLGSISGEGRNSRPPSRVGSSNNLQSLSGEELFVEDGVDKPVIGGKSIVRKLSMKFDPHVAVNRVSPTPSSSALKQQLDDSQTDATKIDYHQQALAALNLDDDSDEDHEDGA
jgi:hypothetical protein